MEMIGAFPYSRAICQTDIRHESCPGIRGPFNPNINFLAMTSTQDVNFPPYPRKKELEDLPREAYFTLGQRCALKKKEKKRKIKEKESINQRLKRNKGKQKEKKRGKGFFGPNNVQNCQKRKI